MRVHYEFLNAENLAMKIFLEDCKKRFLEVFKPAHMNEVTEKDIESVTVFIEIRKEHFCVSTRNSIYKEQELERSRLQEVKEEK